MKGKIIFLGMSLSSIINIIISNGGNMFNWLKNLFSGTTETEASGVRARNNKGQYVKDDKSTPDVNEAYVDGKKPKRKAKKTTAKKAPAKKRGRPRKTTAKK